MLKTINVDQVQLGVYLHALGGAWTHHPFWTTSFLLHRPADLKRLRDSGVTEVVIDTRRGLDPLAAEQPEVKPKQAASVTVVPEARSVREAHAGAPAVELESELSRAWAVCGRARQVVTGLFHEARMGQAIDPLSVGPMVEDITASINRNAGALISLARLKTADDYTYMHSVAVCALMVSLARQLEMDDEATHAAGVAGLLHDLGKAKMPLEILNKPGQLTDEEFQVIRSHPVRGHESLLSAGVHDATALDVCLHHHEKIDGSGYPHRLANDDISLMARMGAVCDVYDAVTSNRPYKAGWQPGESLRRMAGWSGHFDPQVFQAFVKRIGIYPIGSVVQLKSGRLAVVLDQNEQSLLTPRVKVFFSTRSQLPLTPEVVDLSRGTSDGIAGHGNLKEWGLPDVDELWSGIAHRRH